jgi:hypothetical protein
MGHQWLFAGIAYEIITIQIDYMTAFPAFQIGMSLAVIYKIIDITYTRNRISNPVEMSALRTKGGLLNFIRHIPP